MLPVAGFTPAEVDFTGGKQQKGHYYETPLGNRRYLPGAAGGVDRVVDTRTLIDAVGHSASVIIGVGHSTSALR